MYRIPVVIVGGGIVGLSIAYEISKRSNVELALFEKCPFLGDHATGRNSGVLHAGLYYNTDSLKHKFCIEGNRLWREIAKEIGVEINSCGKYLVATSKEQINALNNLKSNAIKNGVTEVRDATKDEISFLSDIVNCHSAFFSPTTAILDPSALTKAMGVHLYNKDIPILLNNEVKEVKKIDDGFVVISEHEELECDYLINAGGGFAVSLRKQLGLLDLEDYFVKGNYVRTTQDIYNESLIYPVPAPEFKGLGVHSSFEMDGTVRFGPNTEDCSKYDYHLSDNVLDMMIGPIKDVFKNIDESKLAVDYCGIRHKIKRNGELFYDFWIGTESEHGIKNYVELCGIESPGLTSAPAISKTVVDSIFH